MASQQPTANDSKRMHGNYGDGTSVSSTLLMNALACGLAFGLLQMDVGFESLVIQGLKFKHTPCKNNTGRHTSRITIVTALLIKSQMNFCDCECEHDDRFVILWLGP
ncbi:MAG: hypothetical protein GY727_11335 [Gammaproteobacteria bacterium]|nr:hypothetical protein [Gammaproteobacteria bacterium]